MGTLWMEIQPGPVTTKVRVQDRSKRTWLLARLPHAPQDPCAVEMLCEAIALWSGRKVCAALVVDGRGTFCATRAWRSTCARLTQPPRVEVRVISAPDREGNGPEGSVRCTDRRRRRFVEVTR